MEYAAGGELFDRIVKAGRFSEDEARYYFQQLVNGIEYCHKSVKPSLLTCKHRCISLQGVVHRDLKLENTLLDGASKPVLKICDFGYSKVRVQSLLQLVHIAFSQLFWTPNPNQQLGLLHTLHPKYCKERSMMERWQMFGLVESLSTSCWLVHIRSKILQNQGISERPFM